MKTTKAILTTTVIIGAAATLLIAQEQRPPQGNRQPQGERSQQGGQGRPEGGHGGGQGMQRPAFPLVEAIDANHDRVIDAGEIANASANLKKLDKNGDGKLTSDEFMPKFGQGGPGGQGGQREGQNRPPGGDAGKQGNRERPKSE